MKQGIGLPNQKFVITIDGEKDNGYRCYNNTSLEDDGMKVAKATEVGWTLIYRGGVDENGHEYGFEYKIKDIKEDTL